MNYMQEMLLKTTEERRLEKKYESHIKIALFE